MTKMIWAEAMDPKVSSLEGLSVKMFFGWVMAILLSNFEIDEKCVKAGDFKNIYESELTIHAEGNWLWAQSKPWEIRCRHRHDIVGPCWHHYFIYYCPWSQAKNAVNASAFRQGFLQRWDEMAETAMAAVVMVCGVPYPIYYGNLRTIACDTNFRAYTK